MYTSNRINETWMKQILVIPVLALMIVGAFFMSTPNATADASAYPHHQKQVKDYYETITNSSGTYGDSQEDPSMIGYRTIFYKSGYTLDKVVTSDVTPWYEELLGNTRTRHTYIYDTW